ncbi:cation channel sperm-associated auxiliary subunit zeta isoform X2 [Erythrolamprus reginae]|uniref:cation channel sperm-associated auxiliary subunit zeta isoform X2 n=1 Tax=Erythrolamprus reginae TaxID=121349 RepID=UPI00396C3372
MQGLKDSIQRKSISTLPLGYFTKAKHLSSSEVAEKEEHPSDEPEPRSWISRFLRRPKPKKAGGFRKKFFKKSQPGGAQVTDLTKIFNEDFYKSQDQRISDDIADEELSPSPEDIPQQEEAKQIQREIKKKEDASSGSMWYMGQGSGYRGMGHAREFSESIFKDKQYRQRFAKHERDSKVSVPLPLQELIEEEVLAILKATLLSYQKKLGVNHPLTKQMEEQVDKIHLQLQGRGFI